MKISQKNRKIGYTYGSVSGSFPFRGEKSIDYESSLERDLIMVLEYDTNVVDVIEQPVTIEYTNNNGRDVTYTPDFLIHYRTPHSVYSKFLKKSRLIEVKTHEALVKDWVTSKPKFKIGFAYAKQQGWRFGIYDESRIRGQCLKNIRFLSRYRKYQFNLAQEAHILNHLKTVGHATIENLLKFLNVKEDEKGIALSQIWHLLAMHVLVCDMTLPLEIGTYIWIRIIHEDFYEDGI